MHNSLAPLLDQLGSLALPFMVTVIVIELALLWIGKKVKMKKEGLVSFLCYGLGNLPYILFFAALQLKVMFWLYENARLWNLSDTWYVWVLCFIAYDFMWWIVHYTAHKVRLLWCIHGVHHTPKEMNMSVAIRGSFFDFFQYVHLVVWLPIFGFHPFMIFIVQILSRLYGVFTHLNEDTLKNTPFFDKFLITPSLHRVHHSSNNIYVDTNFSNLSSIWDRIFRTYQPELKQVKPVFGISGGDKINTESVISSQLGLFKELIDDIRTAPGFIDKVKYLLMPPGWTPGGEGITAKDQRKNAINELGLQDV